MATIILSIVNNETKEIRKCKVESYWDGLDPKSKEYLLYWLTEGNLGSDEERHDLFFEDDAEHSKVYLKIGTTNAYTILDAQLPSGEIIKVERVPPECFGDIEADSFRCIRCFFINECSKEFEKREGMGKDDKGK